ncbi:MAG TPA: hypothetical protein VLD65_02800, partial [Anaerolineales bacterium]|nr:hypothetical protein [Anaerolineales bacterium]
MENEFITRRRLIVILVTVTVMVFIGLVWLIARLGPWQLLGVPKSTLTPDALVMQNCAYPISYWKAHPELYPSQVVIGGTVYQERELEALLADDS